MSAKCPKCKTVLEDADFGIKICGNADCGAMLFVDFDGSVQLSTDVSNEPVPAPAAAKPVAKSTTTTGPESVPVMQVRSHLDSASSSREETFPHEIALPGDDNAAPEELAPLEAGDAAIADEVAAYDFESELQAGTVEEAPTETPFEMAAEYVEIPNENAVDGDDLAAHIPPPPPELVAASEAEAAEQPLNEGDWFDQPLDSAFTTPEQMNVKPGETVDFSDVVEFANSAELTHSPLAYTLWIEGIDSGEIRSRVEDVLSDSRLNFHLADVMKKLNEGVLELRELNPVKASFIASRLRAEAVQFRWRQSMFGGDAEGGAA